MSLPGTAELSVALDAVRSAAKICQVVQAAISPEVLAKQDDSPVTVADFASQAVVCHAIGQAFGSDPVIAEEDSQALHQPENLRFLDEIVQLINTHHQDASSDDVCHWIDRGGAKWATARFWTLDPIDGTKGFLRKGQYAISLALVIDGQLELGVLGCPNLAMHDPQHHTLFYAVRGQGAFSTSFDPNSVPRRIHVTKTTDPALACFCESVESGHSSHSESQQIAKRLAVTAAPIRMDSQAKYASVASGLADAYLRLPTRTGYFEKIWDHAGGVLIVQEAGGKVTDVCGKPLDFSRGRELNQNRGVIATNGALHDAIVCATQSVIASNAG